VDHDKQNGNNIEHKQGVSEPNPAPSFSLIKLSNHALQYLKMDNDRLKQPLFIGDATP